MDIIKSLFYGIDTEYYIKLKEPSSKILKFRVIDEKDVARDFYYRKLRFPIIKRAHQAVVYH